MFDHELIDFNVTDGPNSHLMDTLKASKSEMNKHIHDSHNVIPELYTKDSC